MNKEELKAEFTKRWPDGAAAIKDKSNRQHYHAACLWLGFKEGYEFGRGKILDE